MLGFAVGAYHVLIALLDTTGGGHGHGNPLSGFLLFGYGSLLGSLFFFFNSAFILWIVVLPFQYALYAYVAYRRRRRLEVGRQSWSPTVQAAI